MKYLKALILGIVEGITEWLPVSSTGHLILFEQFLKLDVSEDFWNLFLVVIQLGAILAVVIIFWNQIFPFGIKKKETKIYIKKDIFTMWLKIIVACIPAAVVGLLFDEKIDELFYNPLCISIALIVVGIAFIIVERKKLSPKITDITDLTFNTAFLIGLFQLIAAIFPGTSRSGATIIGGLILGVSRTVAAEFTFYLAIPVMLGASLLKLLKFGLNFTGFELAILFIGLISAFVISIFIIKFLMNFIKKHDFKVFAYYRIVLGIIVLGLSIFA